MTDPQADSPTRHPQRFRKKEHLRTSAEFRRVYAQKHAARDGRLIVYIADNGRCGCRLGVSVGKRVGRAVVRNYVKRRIREAFRQSKAQLPPNLDIVCVARAGSEERTYDLRTAFNRLIRQAHRRATKAPRTASRHDKE